MKNALSLFLFLICFNYLCAQNTTDKLSLLISSRVDTTSNDVKSVIKLYEDYYNSEPSLIYNNPFWNQKEKKQYKDFDFSRSSIFQGGMNAKQLFQYYSPFVLSVEPIGKKYQIRVLFSSATTDPKYAGSKVWCIQKLNAVKENGKWVLENLIVELSKKWLSKKKGIIHYIYPPNHLFDDESANSAEKFCNTIIQRFNSSYNDSFKFYVTSSVDDMGLLENFDYYFVGITTGKAREGIILTSKGNEYYPHELVHKLLPKNPNRSYLIEEGLAVFLGTKEDTVEYKKLLNKLATDLKIQPKKINFKSILSQSVRFNGYQTAYPAGAGVCELVYQLNGDEGLKQLMKSNTIDYNSLIKTLCFITKLTETDLEIEWNKTIEKYYH